ncbi:bifunctional pyr operon transcriptional regulator/uracil phosphoribosyltransferase PyrR [Lacticaseibacillus songhuajiangensis]|jgi:pyrimidine operon attenuation protein/uracil phosphoribosyltransferase|uniref:bifunctional pyr operon transcriptional regulator/uracil phosphoribosyltransferase PyrR n=1 Tax=Lacticaseibacillus songhuajiangensis TaxID=1296539 RepID=UPI000F78422C|nr:bifunctional pyr operon transcriptional regulator/uracil phosphoribosyltransferase PyrR [Lacticaseibacillus songhuajiangensis]
MQSKQVVDGLGIQRALTRITYEVIEQLHGTDQLCIVGIQSRGVDLAQRIAHRLQQLAGGEYPVAALDTRAFRDDITTRTAGDLELHLGVDITGRNILLVDDVLYTGRTIRAAMDALVAAGRPARISLAVLVDRGHRELPIRADFIGKNIPTADNERIQVQLAERDHVDAVNIIQN